MESKAIVYYVDFHWDNYQGGSGKSFEMKMSVCLPDDLKMSGFKEYITTCLEEKLSKDRPFRQDNKCSITRIEIV